MELVVIFKQIAKSREVQCFWVLSIMSSYHVHVEREGKNLACINSSCWDHCSLGGVGCWYDRWRQSKAKDWARKSNKARQGWLGCVLRWAGSVVSYCRTYLSYYRIISLYCIVVCIVTDLETSCTCGTDYVCMCNLCGQERPYHSDSTASRLLSEVKHCRARLVLRWGTTLESLVLFFCSDC